MMLNAVEHRLSFAFLYQEKLMELVNLCADIFTELEAHHDEVAWRYTKPFGMSCSFPRPFRCCRHNLSSCQTSSVETPNQKRHVMSGQCDAPNKETPFAGLSCASGGAGRTFTAQSPPRLRGASKRHPENKFCGVSLLSPREH